MSKAEKIRGEVIEIFDDATGKSRKFSTKADSDALLRFNSETDAEPDIRVLREKMRNVGLKRQQSNSLKFLEDVAEGLDPLLQQSIHQAVASQGGHIMTHNVARDEAVVRYGDEIINGAPVSKGASASTYTHNEAKGKARVHYGNFYGKKSMFDN